MRSGRRKMDQALHGTNWWEELATHVTRAVIIGGLSWLIYTTNGSNATLMLLEWRVMQLEIAVAHRNNP
jgi:hypothetical protein